MALPVEVNSQLLASSAGAYQISRSLRFRTSASAYLNRTPASAGNRKTWTWSGWVKRGALPSGYTPLFSAGTSLTGDSGFLGIRFTANQTLDVTTGSTDLRQTTQVFRDPSAWYHIVVAFDTTQATAANRIRVYVNGSEVTAFGTSNNPALNLDTAINDVVVHEICRTSWNSSDYSDCYLADVNFINGQQLTPSSFGEADSTTGVWKPKRYAGTYGTNGFYLNFSDNSAATAAAIGKDSSGNGNNWTPNNISLTAGATYDSMIDVPTNYDDTTVYGRGNYATMSPIDMDITRPLTLSNANLTATSPANGTYFNGRSTFAIPQSGSWYWEMTITTVGQYPVVGLREANALMPTNEYVGTYANEIAWFGGLNDIYQNGGGLGISTPALSNGDVLMFAYNAGKVWMGRNGTWVNSGNPAAGTGSLGTALTGNQSPAICLRAASTPPVVNANFGQRPFTYTPPSGFKALNTQNLPVPSIKKGTSYMDTNTYTGTSATQTIVNSGGFAPDLVWIKSRSAAYGHGLFDTTRGVLQGLQSNNLNPETTFNGSVTAFNSNGFTLGSDPNLFVNESAKTFVAWQWKKGATPGFDIVGYTGTGANRTIAHSLGVAPSMMIVKCRGGSSTYWITWHSALAGTEYLALNSLSGRTTNATMWNSTVPTSSVFSVGTYSDVNANTLNYIAYLFSEVSGFSKFGTYTGNGSADGPFVYCGFRPRFFMVKNYSSSGNGWAIRDTARDTYNVANQTLTANSSNAEATALYNIDFLSNGFKIRDTGTDSNGSGTSYLFAAFAENPFKYALAR